MATSHSDHHHKKVIFVDSVRLQNYSIIFNLEVIYHIWCRVLWKFQVFLKYLEFSQNTKFGFRIQHIVRQVLSELTEFYMRCNKNISA